MLLKKELISRDLVDKILSWKHTGFDAWIDPAIRDMKEIVEIWLYTIRAPAAAGRLVVGEECLYPRVSAEHKNQREALFMADPLDCLVRRFVERVISKSDLSASFTEAESWKAFTISGSRIITFDPSLSSR